MRQYEVTFIVDPILSGQDIKATAQKYVDQLQAAGCTIVHVNEMGLQQLAYPINKRNTGIYYCVEFQLERPGIISEVELAMRRDNGIIRFLTVALDKYGVKYNEDKRDGKIAKAKRPMRKKAEPVVNRRKKKKKKRREDETPDTAQSETPAPATKEEAPAAVETPAPAVEKKEEE